MIARPFVFMVAAAALAAPANAATVAVQVRDAKGAPVPNAVVSIHLSGRATPLPRPGSAYQVEQRNIQFSPFVLVVPVGAQVTFPNRDGVRHHVYSFAPAKKFELKLYAREDTRSVVFDKAGIVPLGCNIHDAMTGFVVVTDTVWAAKSDASGIVRLTNVPAGALTLDVWHPYLRAPGNRIGKAIQVAASEARNETFAVTLRPPPKPSANY